MSAGSRHIPFERLADLVEGRLSPDEQMQVQEHTSTCSQCAPQLEWLQRVIGLMRDDYEEPPARVVVDSARAFELYRPSSSPSVPRRVMATLRFDSTQQTLVIGRRSGVGAERQLVFTAGSLDLEVRITPSGSLWEVSGQVINDDARGLATLKSTAGEVRAPLNEVSEFLLTPVPAGQYALTLQLSAATIEIPRLEIGA